MKTNYVEMHQTLEERLAQLGSEIPGPMTGFARLHKKAVEEGALSGKVKEMIALAIGNPDGRRPRVCLCRACPGCH
jgi:alkylhydroperoxidase/carboxymuconolactone decarboxylase family protein YurZ